MAKGAEKTGGIARTDATGRVEMIPELLAWSSSLPHDRTFVREDILGSAAHVTMLRKVGLLEAGDAQKLRASLLAMYDAAAAGTLVLEDGEEDVHMAIEGLLTRDLGDIGKRLHTARSRNDQVALDLRLHVRDQAARTLADVVAQAVTRANESPLGSGACSGTSLPIDRSVVAHLLRFSAVTANALDTIGDRDFVLDWTWAGARVLLALSRLSTDVIDFTTSEFGYLRIGDAVAAGSSMMPQKKNPDIFELVRAKASRGVGNVMSMLTLVRGLPTGYNRDFQDDRQAVLDTGPLVRGATGAVRAAIAHLTFDRERCLASVSDGSTQATDIAEALVRKGMPFREAYKATGQLVHLARERNVDLASIGLEAAKSINSAFDEAVLAVIDPRIAVAAKKSAGGTAPERVEEQIAWVRAAATELGYKASSVPTLDDLRRAV
ncbi:MAG: argininosuccinate lyase, partial [Myxococcales bacterium]|nr:argininosuccinate lyase [Myxococcales bacterium]